MKITVNTNDGQSYMIQMPDPSAWFIDESIVLLQRLVFSHANLERVTAFPAGAPTWERPQTLSEIQHTLTRMAELGMVSAEGLPPEIRAILFPVALIESFPGGGQRQ